MREWMTEVEAAEWLGVSPEQVRHGIQSGTIPALRLGDEVRLSRTATIAAMGVASAPTIISSPEAVTLHAPDEPKRDGLPAPAGFAWVERLKKAPAFEHKWPRTRTSDNPATSVTEAYPTAWSGVVDVLGQRVGVLVGQSVPRHDGRPRMTVFFDRYPETEFARTASGDGWASAVKVNGKSTLRVGDPVPPLYRLTRLVPYQVATG